MICRLLEAFAAVSLVAALALPFLMPATAFLAWVIVALMWRANRDAIALARRGGHVSTIELLPAALLAQWCVDELVPHLGSLLVVVGHRAAIVMIVRDSTFPRAILRR